MKCDALRIIDIVNKMKTGEMVKANIIADELEISLRTAQRDIKMIEDMGFEMESKVGKRGGYMFNDNALSKVRGLDESQITLMMVDLLRRVS